MQLGVCYYLLFFCTCTVEPPIKDPSSKGQPPNNGHIAWHQTYGCSVNFSLRAKDNLCIKDKEAAPNVSVVQRLHCTACE